MHDVFPPYRAVVGPGFAMEPRVPQNCTRTFASPLTLLRVQTCPLPPPSSGRHREAKFNASMLPNITLETAKRSKRNNGPTWRETGVRLNHRLRPKGNPPTGQIKAAGGRIIPVQVRYCHVAQQGGTTIFVTGRCLDSQEFTAAEND